MKSSGSLALCGPPKITAPACSAIVVGQRIAEARAADVERIAAVAQRVTDAAGRRLLLMQDEQNGSVIHGVE